MKEYLINNKKVSFDETKTYLDFHISRKGQNLVELDLEQMLSHISKGSIKVDDNLKSYFSYLERWTRDAPRKKFYRNLRKEGFCILSTEQFFDLDEGEEIINSLENTGVFAQYFLKEVYSMKFD